MGMDPRGLALDSAGNALVAAEDAGTNQDGGLFIVDLTPGPTFGDRTLVSDFGDPAQGPIGSDPRSVALDGAGNALVIDDSSTNAEGGLYLVDLTPGPTFGQRTIISDFTNPAQGPLGQTPRGVALDSSGNALVVDGRTGTDDLGVLFRIDLTTGIRTIVSDFGNPAQGPLGAGG